MAHYDYQYFGDILTFDATYKTNGYKKTPRNASWHKPLL